MTRGPLPPADRPILAAHLVDLLDVAMESLGPQCETVSAAGVRCVENVGHNGDCDVRPWRRTTITNPGQETQHG